MYDCCRLDYVAVTSELLTLVCACLNTMHVLFHVVMVGNCAFSSLGKSQLVLQLCRYSTKEYFYNILKYLKVFWKQ